MATIDNLLGRLRTTPSAIEFDEAIAVINAHYDFVPTRFTNGVEGDLVVNEAGQNSGSCRVFAFGLRHQLTEAETLALFGRFYRDDVLSNPEGDDHANIRTFMRHGWAGIAFDADPLIERE